MAHFFALQQRLDEVSKNYFSLTQAASDNLAGEVEAVMKIQSFYRAAKIRRSWHAVVGSTLLMQRIVRGYLARMRTRAVRFEKERRLNAQFFYHCAATIQKFFRGWWSRRHLHDFYGRKMYLTKVEKRGDWTTAYLAQEHQDKLAMAKIEEERQMRQEFDNLAGELHHLVSTKTIAGVYNPPYNDHLPRAFEKPIEQHLRDALRVQVPKSLRRPRHKIALDQSGPHGYSAQIGASHAEMQAVGGGMIVGPPQDLPDRQPYRSRSASAGRMQKVQGPFRSKEQIEVANIKAATLYRSVQASGPYDALEHDSKMQTRLSKLTRMSPMDFVAPGLPPIGPPPSSVHAGVPYRERPVEMRSDYLELPKIRDKPPFFTAMARDKHFGEYNEQHLLPHGHI
eukprot:gb/GFBE01008793.1/.p1 GENE.gb/GFBE01008793.1/~~gb/GFBE01008793.1/.p1  ORF type:complete len:395 (+),score=89.06 gb/GFBE01008793.1/:1-1185(+)